MSNHDRIQKDILAENNVIEKHKKHLEAIRAQIATYKTEMIKTTDNLTERIKNTQKEIDASDVEMATKTKTHETNVTKLKSEIETLLKKHAENESEKQKSTSDHNSKLTNLTSETVKKENEKDEIFNEISKTQASLEDMTNLNNRSRIEVEDLELQVSKLKDEIKNKSTVKKELTTLEIEHTKEIREDIESLKAATKNMQAELGKSKELQNV